MIKFFRSLTRNWLWPTFSLFFAIALILGASLFFLETQLPDTKTLAHVQLQVPLRIFSDDQKLIAIFGNKRRIPVSFHEIPQKLVQAVLATEDQRFYEHPGVDLIGILRAAKAVISSGKRVQGASTITMQVARNFFLNRKKTYGRKITEILLALKIDHEFSKQKILELYLNKVYLGYRAYGVAAAAQVYYGKTLDELTLAESAMIAGLPQAPSSDNPLVNPKGALSRRNHVLERMLDGHYIDEKTYQHTIATPITASYHARTVQFNAPYIAELVRQKLVARYGKEATYNSGLIVKTTINSKRQRAAQQSVKQGLIDYSERHGYIKPQQNFGTPSDSVKPEWIKKLEQLPAYKPFQPAIVWSVAEQEITALLNNGQIITIPWQGLSWARPRLNDNLALGPKPKQASSIVQPGDLIQVRSNSSSKTVTSWRLGQIPVTQSALVAMNPNNGAIEAMVGGFNFYNNKFNRATQAIRQPGSAFKPFIYSAALDKGYTLASTINDAPIVVSDSGENELWRPHNVNLSFNGPTRLSVGLSQSRNLVSIRLLKNIGIPYTLNYMKRFGFDPSKLPNSLSLALGTASLTPLQLAQGYAVIANGGFLIKPHLMTKISRDDGTVLYEANEATACTLCLQTNNPNLTASTLPGKQAPESITPQNAYLMNHALINIISHGTGRAARSIGRHDLGGKTGSTNQQIDAWFAGFNPSLVAVVWVGRDNFQSIHEYGAQAALPIWINFMKQSLHGTPELSLPKPAGIINVRIDPASGLLAAPGQKNAIFELFRTSHTPKQVATLSSTNGNFLSQIKKSNNKNHNNSKADEGEDAPLF